MSEESFGTRLRRERERRQIALSSICANTKINVAIFEGLERGDVSRWPSGIFRRSFIRAYAEGVGLDPDLVTQEFLTCHPDPAVPAAIADVASSPTSAPPAHSTVSGIRLRLADSGAPFLGGRVLTDMRRRLAAAACDAAVVMAIAAILFAASGKFWLPLSVTMLSYYLGGIVVLGNTPGVCLWASNTARARPRGTAVTIASTTLLKTAVALRARFQGSASAGIRQQNARSEPRASRS